MKKTNLFQLVFLVFEIVAGLLLGLIPGIDNFSHIGGFSMGILLAILLFPVLHQTITHRWTFYTVRVIGLIGAILMFVLLYRNFFTEDPAASCDWCRYLSCWPTASNNVSYPSILGLFSKIKNTFS
jgi:membrane associated rhomboid family serine protease